KCRRNNLSAEQEEDTPLFRPVGERQKQQQERQLPGHCELEQMCPRVLVNLAGKSHCDISENDRGGKYRKCDCRGGQVNAGAPWSFARRSSCGRLLVHCRYLDAKCAAHIPAPQPRNPEEVVSFR